MALIFFHTLKNIKDKEVILKNLGNKARNLYLLYENGFNIPKTAVIPFNSSITEDELKTLKAYLKEPLIVRSSSNVEDSSHSFAGLFESVLCDYSSLKQAIKQVYKSKNSKAVKEYKRQLGLNMRIKMAVIIQEFVEGDYSGVYFSSHPINHKELIEITRGDCRKVVNGISSSTFIINKSTIDVLNNEENIDLNQVMKILKEIRKLKEVIDYEYDCEFTVKNEKVYFLQVRPITYSRLNHR